VREEKQIPSFDGVAIDVELRALKRSDVPGPQFQGYGVTHNWTHVAGLMQLKYYKDLELPHNINVLHIEKNVAESVFNTVLKIAEKTMLGFGANNKKIIPYGTPNCPDLSI
jgi:hypothetical protein